ncbi:MAG: hypothetical protein KatS3mg012_0642 [Gaiellaceae bacterium]|nr:MAG: hypothetical protein KatS3mg012_0642 [Gaiellaceae bacterium]
MSGRTELEERDGQGGHGGHGFWAMVACCVPMLVIFALIALKVI